MSKKSSRKIDRIDYEVLNRTGEKVISKTVSDSEIESLTSSLEEISIMSNIDSLKYKAKKVVKEMSRFLEINDLEDVTCIDEVNERIEGLSSLYSKHADIFDDLQDAIGMEAFEQEFRKSAQAAELFKNEITKAKKAKRKIQKEEEEKKEEIIKKEKEEREEKLRQERKEDIRKQEEREEKLRQERKEDIRKQEEREEKLRQEQKEEIRKQEEREDRLRREQIERDDRLRKELLEREERFRKEQVEKENDQKKARVYDDIGLCVSQMDVIIRNFPIDQQTVIDEITMNIRKLLDYTSHYNYLAKKLKSISETDEVDDKELESVHDYIDQGNKKIDSLIEEANTINEEVVRQNKVEEENERLRKTKEKMVCKRMIQEINMIEDDLKNIQSIKVADLDDRELLDREKDLKLVESSVSCLSEKLTTLYKQLPLDYDHRTDIIDQHSSKEKELRRVFETYKDNLRSELANRNVSKDSSARTESLKIKLSKFGGYNSTVDIYTFQSEFERLYLSSMQKKLLPDYLKNNHLESQALILVRYIEDLDEIWSRLRNAFGDTELLLINKLKVIEKMGAIWKMRDKSKLVQVLTQLLFAMQELQRLAEKHDIENDLYHGNGILKVYKVIGFGYRDKFIRKICTLSLTKKELWNRLLEFISKEASINEKICLVEQSSQPEKPNNSDFPLNLARKGYMSETRDQKIECSLCGKTDHVVTIDHFGRKVVQYFSCKMFTQLTPKERFKLLYDKKLCYQCLAPGVSVESGKHKSGTCYGKFTCKHKSHLKFPRKKHVLLCEDHKEETDNLDLFEKYKKENILSVKTQLAEFSKNIKLSFHCYINEQLRESYQMNVSDEIMDSSAYILQTISVNDKRFNIFFDTGCGDLVCRKRAISELENMRMAELIVPGPIVLGGVGDMKTVSKNGVYKVAIPLYTGQLAKMRGVCLDQVTAEFPVYPLKDKVEGDIISSYKKVGNDPIDLPRLPDFVGGHTDLMLGIKYLKYFPEFVFRLPTGLTIYKSQFLSPDGSRGVVGGPHHVFTEIERQCAKSFMSLGNYFAQQLELVRMGYQVNPDVQLLGYEKELIGDLDIPDNGYKKSYGTRKAIKKSKLFESVEEAGTEVTYRCVKCRDCSDCKKSEQIQCISIQEEIEQDIIDRSVTVDVARGVTTARLPFLENPLIKLCSNKESAMAVYKGQVKNLEKNPNDKFDVIESEKKMQKLEFVDKVEDLTPSQREAITSSCLQYFIPWRVVWNSNSLSTPCRLVFDASQVTKSGYSLNSVLAKGRNNMNKLIEILVRWSSHRYGFHTDISKMYNTIKLSEEDWCYQLYLWHDELSVTEEPILKVIKTIIYGVKSSGNQAESGLRKTAKKESNSYPRVSNIIQKDVYVDDCVSGEQTWEKLLSTTDDLQIVLAKGGFSVKGFTFSGRKPPANLSSDGVSIKVAGLRWYSEEDTISLETGDLNFSKKVRGKKSTITNDSIPKDFTRRDCVGRLAEVYDLLGKVTPITCGMKLDLRTLVDRKLDWDDKIPNDLKEIWFANFRTIRELANVRFNRAIVPEDAVSLDIDTIDTGDASNSLICSAIYARFLKRDGSYSCQLVLSKSKLVPNGMTLPRAELFAAKLNASIGHVVKLAFGNLHKECIKLTDSQITLHWISNTKNPLKQWVRNNVVEINRLADRSLWRYVPGKKMVADLGTRKGARIEDVLSSSVWINGLDWMITDKKDFPVKNVRELKLGMAEIEHIKGESLRPECVDQVIESEDNEASDGSISYPCIKVDHKVVAERYIFSQYVVDPNKFRLRKVIRIVTLVILFVRKLQKRNRKTEISTEASPENSSNLQYIVTSGSSYATVNAAGKSVKLKCKPGQVICLRDSDIQLAYEYFFRRCTEEIKKFVDKKLYEKISVEKNGILYYTGRILASQEFGGNISFSDVMIDLTSSTFAVPLVDCHSPFAYSIVNEVHWFHPVAKHSGIETVLRYTMKYAHILEGRELVRRYKKDCARCRILSKRTVDVVMGPVSQSNLTIAPAFFISQVDLFGPVKSYSVHNKRATISLWFLIFCCSTTGAVSLKVMESYSTTSFLLGFIRFSCCFGYPKILLPDEGSQLVKGCKEMELNYNDIKHRLNTEYGVEFETCPVGGHNMHGKVERKIQHVKAAMNKELSKDRLSAIQWETLGDQIANCVNDTPLAVKYVPRDIEQMDLLTPNRLILGRNNNRSPAGPLRISSDPNKIIKQNEEIMRVWFECWLVCHVPKLMEQPKWFTNDRDMKMGDVVLFLRKEKEYAGNYQYGLVKSVEMGRDSKIRSVVVEYQNHTESVKRETRRAVREIVVVHPIDELGITRELGEIATQTDMSFKVKHDN